MVNTKEFYRYMSEGKIVEAGSEMALSFDEMSQEALKITAELNNKYHTPEQIVKIFSKLTGKNIVFLHSRMYMCSVFRCCRNHRFVLCFKII